MINKILFTIFAIIAIWKAFSLITRLQKDGGILAKSNDRQPPKRPADPSSEAKAVEMRPCPRCGAYIDPRENCSCRT
ncbi:MAG: hypothetical protein ACR2RA_06400 [Geminicoccaceae bacterium]